MLTARFWLQLALLFCGAAYAAPHADRLQTGMSLVATTNLQGTSFDKSVILITQYNQQGTLGIAINRPSHQKLSDFFPDFKAIAGNYPLHLGGPVRPLALFVLARTKARDGWLPVTGDIYVTGGVEAHRFLNQRQNNLPTSAFRVYAGYSGWAPDQLENEIQRGDWLTVMLEPDTIFSNAPEVMWEQLYRLNSGKWI